MHRSVLPSQTVFCAAIVTLAASIAVSAQAPPPAEGAFTAAQAAAGGVMYNEKCAGCHGGNLEGSGDAPALAGGTFMLQWRAKPVSDLIGNVLKTMPMNDPGSLSEVDAISAVAYILQRNGAQPGEQALGASTAAAVGAVANGQAPAAAAPAPGSQWRKWRLGGAGRRRDGPFRRRQRRQLGCALWRDRSGRSQELRSGDPRDARASALRPTG